MKKAIVISLVALLLNVGTISAPATPFTEKDTIRVIMNLQGSGEVIGFQKEGRKSRYPEICGA